LSFAGPIDLDVAYIKGVAGGIYIEDVEQVRRCRTKFDRISEAALNETESIEFIETLIKEYRTTSTEHGAPE
jgi:hypothetical protein